MENARAGGLGFGCLEFDSKTANNSSWLVVHSPPDPRDVVKRRKLLQLSHLRPLPNDDRLFPEVCSTVFPRSLQTIRRPQSPRGSAQTGHGHRSRSARRTDYGGRIQEASTQPPEVYTVSVARERQECLLPPFLYYKRTTVSRP